MIASTAAGRRTARALTPSRAVGQSAFWQSSFTPAADARTCSQTVTSAHVRIACGICGLRCCRSPARALSSRGRPESRLPGTALRGGEDLRPGQRLPALRAQREARRPAAKTSGPPGTLASTLTGPGRSGARVLLVLPQRSGGVKTRSGPPGGILPPCPPIRRRSSSASTSASSWSPPSSSGGAGPLVMTTARVPEPLAP